MSGSNPDAHRRSTRPPRASRARERRHLDARAAAAERERRRRLVLAKRAWGRLSPAAQFELVRELVETRADELRRAYTGVLSIAAGHSRYRLPGARRKSVDREPAVTFLVERKWASKRKTPRPGDVPERLFAYASIDGRRELCAVPTDVEDAREYRLKAQAASQVLVTPPSGLAANTATGAITCVIRRSAGAATAYLLSCRHVFGLTASAANHPVGATVTRNDGGRPAEPVLARVDDIYGPLSSDSDHNFDVALARLEVGEDASALSTVLDRLAPADGLRYVDGFGEIERLGEYLILAPNGVVKRATFVRGWPPGGQPTVDYGHLGSLGQGVVVIESSVTVGTAGGDSGAPVVTLDRTRLVGMHFAGFDEKAYMIPAYELVQRKNYVGFSDGAPFVIS